MKKSIQVIGVISVILILAISSFKTVAQTQPSTPSANEFANAITVGRVEDAPKLDFNLGSPLTRPQAGSKASPIYRLTNCDSAHETAACYFRLTGRFITGGSGSQLNSLSGPTAQSSGTIVCGLDLYNYGGTYVARLQQNVNTTFHVAYGKTPLTFNWGDFSGTWTVILTSWNNLTQTTNPAFGVRSGNSASSVGQGTRVAGGSIVYSTRIQVSTTGWSCTT